MTGLQQFRLCFFVCRRGLHPIYCVKAGMCLIATAGGARYAEESSDNPTQFELNLKKNMHTYLVGEIP